jgi:hypothetical protein
VRRLPETVQVLYAELLDQLRAAENEVPPTGGSYVSKTIGNGRYWYLQRNEAGRRTQTYLGPETPELLQKISSAREQQTDLKRRRQLVSMLAAGGAASEPAPFTAVLQVLAESFVFRLGGVLVGTQAFLCYANMLGVRFEAESLRTADIDVAESAWIALESVDLLKRLRARGRHPRVNFLRTTRRGVRTKPIPLPHLPVEGLDYLIEKTTKAAHVGGGGVLVNVPLPARYAVHKLWVAKNRPVSEQAKARKDRAQARQLVDVLLADRPADLEEAVVALRRRPALWKRIHRELDELTAGQID